MDDYRNIAMQWIDEPEHRPAVEAAARHLHANESLHLHDKINDTEPCSYCWLRAAKTVQAIERGGQRILPTRDDRPTIVVLCGSTRFSAAFREANLNLTLAGKIVLSIGCDTRSDAEMFSVEELKKVKADLDELHKRKIDLADEVYVLNVGGYIGESTRSEIEYARKIGRPVRYLEGGEV